MFLPSTLFPLNFIPDLLQFPFPIPNIEAAESDHRAYRIKKQIIYGSRACRCKQDLGQFDRRGEPQSKQGRYIDFSGEWIQHRHE